LHRYNKGVCFAFASLTPSFALPRAVEALAAAGRLEGVGWAFAPTGRAVQVDPMKSMLKAP